MKLNLRLPPKNWCHMNYSSQSGISEGLFFPKWLTIKPVLSMLQFLFAKWSIYENCWLASFLKNIFFVIFIYSQIRKSWKENCKRKGSQEQKIMLLLLNSSLLSKIFCEYEHLNHSWAHMKINRNKASIVRSEVEFSRSPWMAPKMKINIQFRSSTGMILGLYKC